MSCHWCLEWNILNDSHMWAPSGLECFIDYKWTWDETWIHHDRLCVQTVGVSAPHKEFPAVVCVSVCVVLTLLNGIINGGTESTDNNSWWSESRGRGLCVFVWVYEYVCVWVCKFCVYVCVYVGEGESVRNPDPWLSASQQPQLLNG